MDIIVVTLQKQLSHLFPVFCLIIQRTVAFLLENCYNYNKKTGLQSGFCSNFFLS